MMEWLMAFRDGTALWLSLEVVRATVLLGAALTAAVVLRRASAASRHLVWCAALVSLLALPAVSAVMPWRWSPLPAAGPDMTQAQAQAPVARESRDVGAAVAGEVRMPSSPVEALRTVPPTVLERATAFTLSNVLEIVLVLWAAGAVFSLLRLALGGVVLRATVRRARPLDAPAWRTPLFEAADRLELPTAPRLVASERMPMPFVTGLVRPTIVLPANAETWSMERRRAVLLHELAHVRRRDLLLNTVAHVACALWWFHPLARVAARRLRAESERACDDLVLRVGTLPSAYADHLLQIVRDAGRMAAPAVALPMAQRREFEGRMLAILEADARRDPPRRRHTVLALIACALLTVPLAGLGPVPVSADASEPSLPLPAQDGGDSEAAEPSEDAADPVVAEDLTLGDAAEAPGPATDGDATSPPQLAQDTGVIGALRAALRDESGEVRQEAAWALASMHAVSAGPDLAAMLGREVHAEARTMAVWALTQLDHAEAVGAIETVARSDDDPETREMAVWALGQFELASSLPVLNAALADEDAEVRSIAAWAIGTLQPADASAALIAALEDADGEVREHAAWALGQIGDADAIPALTRVMADDEAGEAALWAIGNIGGEAARPALMEALRNGNDEVRAAAARALAGRGGGQPWPWPWPRPITRH